MGKDIETTELVDSIAESYDNDPSFLIPIMQDIQAKCGYLPQHLLKYLSKKLNVPLSQIYGITTFYSSFTLVPRGQHTLTLCMGTVCFLKGARRLAEIIQEELKVEPGGTSPDRRFTFETVNCVGACALAPVMIIDGKYYHKVKPGDIAKILADYEAPSES